jgi:hypothetical protein
MICDCCRRQVDHVRASFWLREARICGECLAEWCDPDNDHVDSADTASIGNFVRLKHGLPPLAAALALSLAIITSTAHASRYCLGHAEAGRTWPTRMLAQDGDGCWTYDHRPPTAEAPASMPDAIMAAREPMLMDRWPDENMLWIELRDLEPEPVSKAEPIAANRHVALLVSLVLATMSVLTVATGWQKGRGHVRPASWPRPRRPTAKLRFGKLSIGQAQGYGAPLLERRRRQRTSNQLRLAGGVIEQDG